MSKDNKLTLNDSGYQLGMSAFRRNSALKLSVTDWLADLPGNISPSDLVEVQFKNTRKGYFHNTEGLPLEKGVIVAVESSPGHDIGEVTLTGELVAKQIEKNHIDLNRYEIRKVYRLASENDLAKAAEAHAKEQDTMIQARQLAKDLGLKMKIGDVEYQGDGTKAIFYYIADERVDFRQLIKVFAETFRVRIEMKQIGARQEAGRIGGTGPCGRELCCATWMSQFCSVGTSAARLQNISPNPQKLAGQCAKLKCCLNFEIDVYKDAMKSLPNRNIPLETQDGTFYYFSADVLKQEITYSSAPNMPANLHTLSAEEAQNIIAMNNRGEKPVTLGGKEQSVEAAENLPTYQNVVGQDDLTRFDKKKGRNNRPNNRSNNRPNNRDNRDNRPRDNRDNRPRDNRPNRPNQGNRSANNPNNANTNV